MADAAKGAEAPQASANMPYDLMIVTDATASMGEYLNSLTKSLPEIIRISALTGCFSRIGVVAYRDYSGGDLIEWSKWHLVDGPVDPGQTVSRAELLGFVGSLVPDAGGDWPEAAKTGLAAAYEQMRADAKTIMLLFADAPPHTAATKGTNRELEQASLGRKDSYGGTGSLFVDWVQTAHLFRTGPKQCKVFSIIDSHLIDTLGSFTLLSGRTRGTCIRIPSGKVTATFITELTITTLLAWMGIEKEGAFGKTDETAVVAAYKHKKKLAELEGEADDAVTSFMVVVDTPQHCAKVAENVEQTTVPLSQLKDWVHPRPPVEAFSKRYLADPAYRALVVDNLAGIIASDVTSIAVNPVFGTLWRTVCNDRANPARDELVAAFGGAVDRIPAGANAADGTGPKDRMKAWLEQSYDYAADIHFFVESVPEDRRFPCLYLDPTLDFQKLAADIPGDDEAMKTLSFTREELLEIGRSCDYRILRRLGRILACLSFARTKDELPAHIESATEEEVPRIPLALALEEHQKRFWKVLLHVVVPGTMLSARPAALLAALSIRMGIAPLAEVAEAEMAMWTERWNTMDFPETWNVSCLNLLLDADKEVRRRRKSASAVDEKGAAAATRSWPLKDEDRALFRALIDYKLLDFNMATTLRAKVGWSPNKTRSPMGPFVKCKRCKLPRSVTVMGANGTCGLCAYNYETNKEREEHVLGGDVPPLDSDVKTPLAWVECSVRACRAQYVVYHVKALNVKPKCHYCRLEGQLAGQPKTKGDSKAPLVECKRCLSRIIWPLEYRPVGFVPGEFECPACEHGDIETIVDAETSARELAAENGSQWLLRNDGCMIQSPLTGGGSLYKLVSSLKDGTAGFSRRVEVLPGIVKAHRLEAMEPKMAELAVSNHKAKDTPAPTTKLTLQGKHIHNTADVLASLASWVLSRRAELGVCTLCFTGTRKDLLRLACGGRAGCRQRVCASCHAAWYGQNRAGAVLNLAALECPFCCRRPTPGVVPAALASLAGLRDALAERGQWVHAWCAGPCGSARRLVERSCAAGAPVAVEGWRCEDCEEEALRRAEEEARALELAVRVAEAADREEAEARARAARARAARVLVVRQCPRCRVETVKAGGCNHMTCSCGAHWCWVCGKASKLEEIYAHISAAHGGLFGGDQAGDLEGEFEAAEFRGDVLEEGESDEDDY